MNKMNKKGFTLIEMLVVIAIIAVLVSIIIPTVSSSTAKAAAATNAANLRSLKAEAVTASLTKMTATANLTLTYDANGNIATVVANDNAPLAKVVGECTTKAKAEFAVGTDGGITATYGGKNIKYFADVAENGLPASK